MSAAIKKRLADRTPVIGSWISLPDAGLAEIMSRADFDFLTIDMEHSAITIGQAQELVRVISLCGVCPLVRLPSNDGALIKRVLDAGADGIIVPMVNTAAEARSAVRAAKYPPAGVRSVGLARAQEYGPGFERYMATANADTLVVVQIEHREAVKNIDAILRVPGIDAFMVGPYDLSASLNVPGELDHPTVTSALRRVLQAGRKHGVPSGFHSVWPSTEQFMRKLEEGFTLLAYSADFLMLGETCRRDLATIRRQIPAPSGSRPRRR